MTLKKVVCDYVCNGCGAKKTETTSRSVLHYLAKPKGWTIDRTAQIRGKAHHCAACTRAVATARRTALAARRKRSKK